MPCQHCGYNNNPSDQICAQCGAWLPDTQLGQEPAMTGPFGNAATGSDSSSGASDFFSSSLPPSASPPSAYPPSTPSSAAYGSGAGGYAPNFPQPSPNSSDYRLPPSAEWAPYGGPWDQHSSGPSYFPSSPDMSGVSFDAMPRGLVVPQGRSVDQYYGSPAAVSAPLELGTLLKGTRYRLIQPFNRGARAGDALHDVPLMIANDTEAPNTQVLIQELPLTRSGAIGGDSAYARQVIAQRLTALSYTAGLARLIDSFSERNHHYLVFELPGGDLLSERLRRAHGPIPETTAVGLAKQLLDVLAGLERERPPVVHGNIAPENIILRPNGQLALVGVAPLLLLYPDGQVPGGAAGGVAGFAAPEQTRGQASVRSDLYAVCAVLYLAVTGIAPTLGATALYQPAHRLNPQVSLELEEILSKGLRPSPTQRFQSASELRAALLPLLSGRKTTHAADDEGGDPERPALVPVRDARGRFVVPRQPMLQNPLVIVALIVLLLVTVGGGALYVFSPHTTTGATTLSALDNQAASLFQTKGIGLSAGTRVFDTERPDNTLKQKAARLLATGDSRASLVAFTQAMAADPSDPEAAIYAANAQITVDRSPYVTLVAAVAYGADDPRGGDSATPDFELARTALQGVYLAQQRINASGVLPGNTRAKVFILNSGANADGATLASHLLLDEIRAGNAEHIVGIIAWPNTAQTKLAISTLAPSGLAVLSPIVSDDTLGGPASVFSLVPPDSVQAANLADAAAHQLKARRVLIVSNPTVPANAAMAKAFDDRMRDPTNVTATVVRRDQFTPGATADFDAAANDALSLGVDTVYLAGDDWDSVNLAHAMARVFANYYRQPHILVGPTADTQALLGLGDSPAATAIRKHPTDLDYLYVASLASMTSWSALGGGETPPLDYNVLYHQQFGGNAPAAPGATPPALSILSYDAARVLVAAAAKDVPKGKDAKWTLDPTSVRTRLRQFDVNRPYLGLSGAIAFKVTGGQAQKSFAIMSFEQVPAPADGQPIAIATVFVVIGGKPEFCGASNCQST